MLFGILFFLFVTGFIFVFCDKQFMGAKEDKAKVKSPSLSKVGQQLADGSWEEEYQGMVKKYRGLDDEGGVSV